MILDANGVKIKDSASEPPSNPPGGPRSGLGESFVRQFLALPRAPSSCSENTPFPGCRQAMLVISVHLPIPIGGVSCSFRPSFLPRSRVGNKRDLWSTPGTPVRSSSKNIHGIFTLRGEKKKKGILPPPCRRRSHPTLCTSPSPGAPRRQCPAQSGSRANKRQTSSTNTSRFTDSSSLESPPRVHSFIRLPTETVPPSHIPRDLPRFDGQVPAAWADAVASSTNKGVRGRSVDRCVSAREFRLRFNRHPSSLVAS
ncbi:hypothetical protein QBC39DRAFT_56216 [Podospora conica]|nr:hypothetical protein QBC39DRAFT_56216 [Schizothecium conicum]